MQAEARPASLSEHPRSRRSRVAINSHYIGRFAPSPTGPLHFGSLVAAMGSYLQARSQGGQWLLRIEDIDPPREVSGAADSIIRSLENLGFEWDQSIFWQHRNLDRHRELLDNLRAQDLLYACCCSRRQLAAARVPGIAPGVYPGACRERSLNFAGNSLRIRVAGDIQFKDAIQGVISESLPSETGDFIVKRRDGLIAYQLAVVIDDADQQISEVVRGADLLDNTARQIFLLRSLDLATPDYCHLPVAVDAQGIKLSKQTHADPIDKLAPVDALLAGWQFLGQRRVAPHFDSVEDFWRWAVPNWSLTSVPQSATRSAPPIN